MLLNNVNFNIQNGNLGRLDVNEDNISALLFSVAPPTALAGAKVKGYRSLKDAVTDGITEASATYAELHYHIKEFFRQAEGALLYVGFNAVLVTDVFTATQGAVKQVGIYITDFSMLGNLQAQAEYWAYLKAPIYIVAAYAGPIATSTTMLTASNWIADKVSCLVAGDGGAKGKALATLLGKQYIPALGAVLGATARAKVSESIAWVEKFNFSNGVELDKIALMDGTINPSETVLDELNTKRYLCFRKFVGRSGSYLNDNHNASPVLNNDYAYMNDVRVMNKARRELYKQFLPKLNAPLPVDAATGALRPTLIDNFVELGGRALNPMQANDEISGFDVLIDPNQDVLATSILLVQVRIVVNGVARNIVIDLGVTSKLA